MSRPITGPRHTFSAPAVLNNSEGSKSSATGGMVAVSQDARQGAVTIISPEISCASCSAVSQKQPMASASKIFAHRLPRRSVDAARNNGLSGAALDVGEAPDRSRQAGNVHFRARCPKVRAMLAKTAS